MQSTTGPHPSADATRAVSTATRGQNEAVGPADTADTVRKLKDKHAGHAGRPADPRPGGGR